MPISERFAQLKMKLTLILVPILVLTGCDQEKANMNASNLPTGWTAGEVVPHDQTYSDPPESGDASRIQFYGLRESDPGHRLYSIPAGTPIADVVRVFKVGSHGADSYSYDVDETIGIVAGKASKIAELFPCRVTLADAAGLKLKFRRQILDEDLDKLSELFSEDEGFQSGTEGYIIEQEEGRHLFQRVKEENLFHFWWD